jgi:hypothetical protein
MPKLYQLPSNFEMLHHPSLIAPSPILWLNDHCEINDADPNLVPCDRFLWLFQLFSGVGDHLENATGAPETPSHVHFHKTWLRHHEKQTPPWRPPISMAVAPHPIGINTCISHSTQSVVSSLCSPTIQNHQITSTSGAFVIASVPPLLSFEFH